MSSAALVKVDIDLDADRASNLDELGAGREQLSRKISWQVLPTCDNVYAVLTMLPHTAAAIRINHAARSASPITSAILWLSTSAISFDGGYSCVTRLRPVALCGETSEIP